MNAAARFFAKPIRFGLVLIMLIGYVFMALTINEQNRIIDNQRSLIRALYSDTVKLTIAQVQKQYK